MVGVGRCSHLRRLSGEPRSGQLRMPTPTTVTLDTNVSPPETVTALVPAPGFDFVVVSVTDRETAGTSFQVRFNHVGRVAETAVYGESTWGNAVWGGEDDSGCLEAALGIISDKGSPKQGQRDALTSGQRRQLRDAMIFCAHVRERREIFVTNDANAFIDEGRREKLERQFNTRIMKAAEFVALYGTSNS